MKLIADTHTHTIMSTHAYSTLQEMVHAAHEKGLYAIGITDHGYTMPGGPGPWYFANMKGTVPDVFEGVRVLCGCEANVTNFDGDLDVPANDLRALNWVVASIHECCMPFDVAPTKELCTNLWMRVAENPYVTVIGHSGNPDYMYDYETVIPYFGKMGKLVEINSHSFAVRKSYVQNCRRIAEICKECKVPIIVNSDAHFSTGVADFEDGLRMLAEIDFPEELVINSSVERFEGYLNSINRN